MAKLGSPPPPSDARTKIAYLPSVRAPRPAQVGVSAATGQLPVDKVVTAPPVPPPAAPAVPRWVQLLKDLQVAAGRVAEAGEGRVDVGEVADACADAREVLGELLSSNHADQGLGRILDTIMDDPGSRKRLVACLPQLAAFRERLGR